MAKKMVTIDIDGILNMTPKAVCVDVGEGRYNGVWVPISLVEGVEGMDEEEFGEWCATTKEITIPEWFGIQSGLV